MQPPYLQANTIGLSVADGNATRESNGKTISE